MAGYVAPDAAQALTIRSPAKGWVLPLSKAPDPAFASGALGQGIVLELLDRLICSPCDARVVAIATSHHAITLEVAGAAQILIHCGIDTVALGGAPFTLLVEDGAPVKTGDPLMRVDLEAVARGGKSLATPIVLIEPAGHELVVGQPYSRLVGGDDEIFRLASTGRFDGPEVSFAEYRAVREIALPLPHGLHARPAAAIAAEAARWSGPISVSLDGKSANARSTTALMKLGATLGAILRIEAGGDDAEAAVEALAGLIEEGADDDISGTIPPDRGGNGPRMVGRVTPQAQDLPTGTIAGVAAAPGQALGESYYLQRARLEISETSRGADIERARLAEGLYKLREQLGREAHGALAGIAAAHDAILGDAALIGSIEARIDADESAAVAWQGVMSAEAASLRSLPDPRLAERADDFADLEQQLLRILTGKESGLTAPAGSIVIASDLYPSDLAPLVKAGIAGIATMAGGPTSHLAILAASAGVPMAVAFGKPLCEVEEGEVVYLDGDGGRLVHSLSDEDRAALSNMIAQRAAAHKSALASAREDTYLASGERIEVFANLGSVADAEEAVALGAEGSGLLRTEFLFLDRAAPPGEDEQAEIYRAIMECFGGCPVIIRTLDIGADKPAPYLPLDKEDNPALGVRGIRIGLRYPDLLKTQLRAILRAAGERTAHIMAPMVASVEEIESLRTMLDEVVSEMGHMGEIKLGAMVETPASALISPGLAARLDFLSVGTNDLTQYTLAVDRTNPELATMLDPMHPAVLRLIGMAGEACEKAERLLGVCGSAAGDHTAAAVLIGLGVTELSASAARIPELKQHLRRLTLDQCCEAANASLATATPQDAREAAEKILIREDEG